MKPLKVQYDKPETVVEMLDRLVNSDPIELRDVAINLLDDVETLKAEIARADRAGLRRAVEALRDRSRWEYWLLTHSQRATVSNTELAALYLEFVAANEGSSE